MKVGQTFCLGFSLLFNFCSLYPAHYFFIPQGKGRAVKLDENWRGTLIYYRVNQDGSRIYSSEPFKDDKKKRPIFLGLIKKVRKATLAEEEWLGKPSKK